MTQRNTLTSNLINWRIRQADRLNELASPTNEQRQFERLEETLELPVRDGGVEADGAHLLLKPERLGPLHARAALHPGLLAILGVSIFTTWWPNSNTKGTSVRKSSRRSRRKKPRGASVPREGVEGSAESLKAGWGKPHGGECWESSCGGEAASARELPQETGEVDQGGNVSADTSSELLRNQPSITNMEELARSLMESLDITQICLDLLGKLKETQPSTAPVLCGDVKKEHLVCPQCRRCLVGSCPHYSEPMAEQELPVLAAFLHTVDILVHEEDLQLEVGLGFELAVGGEPGYVWEITQRLPEIAPERCCKDCKAPLPRSPGESEGSQPFFPVLRAQGAAAGEMGAARQDARAPPARPGAS
ncbi:uncharacterized protein [Ciconia boyciana]|uniref:uncharacterized protein n=1 Tax=Ciconia boyciana TaxID=52775 RepID=UPI003BA02D81